MPEPTFEPDGGALRLLGTPVMPAEGYREPARHLLRAVEGPQETVDHVAI